MGNVKSCQPSTDMPLVTIIMAVWNGEKTIEKAIQSVKSQTYPNIEFIVVDAASTDRTLGILKKYEANIDSDVEQVTYVDTDLFFFDQQAKLLEEFRQSGKDGLISEHPYAPDYDQASTSERFCVQFMTFRNTLGGRGVLHWWQDRCIEWCFDRVEEGRFGDQKYLDEWPTLFPDETHILQQTHLTLAPWNVRYFAKKSGKLTPVFYHFHD